MLSCWASITCSSYVTFSTYGWRTGGTSQKACPSYSQKVLNDTCRNHVRSQVSLGKVLGMGQLH